MLHATRTPAAKRAALREGLRDARASGRPMRFPGAFNPLSARLVQEKGFEGVYVSGAVVSAELVLPDIGLTTLPEVAGFAGSVARVTDLPVLVDVDTGFGEPMNVARTVQVMEDAGVAGVHVEDQVNPKRCGHLDGKSVVPLDVAVRRIAAAVGARRDGDLLVMARTDVRGLEGLGAAVDRAKALVDAGADAVFPEAMATLEEFEAVTSAVDVPVLANMTEFGKSDLFTVQQLADVGVALVIFPVSLLRLAMGAAERGLDLLAAEGSLTGAVGQMQTRARLYELLDYAGYAAFDGSVADFDLSTNRGATP
jgi:methylisocitrate lyase